MKQLIFLLFLNSSSLSFCQFISNKLTQEKVDKDVKGTTTLVALTGIDEFDEELKKGMKEYWNITEYDFVNKEEIEAKRSNPEYTFLEVIDLKVEAYSGTHYIQEFVFSALPQTTNMPITMLASAKIDDPLSSEIYRACHLVKFVHDAILLAIEGKKDNRGILQTHYNSLVSRLTKKTLLINEKDMEFLKVDDLKKLYPYSFKIVSPDKIREAIESKDDTYCYLVRLPSWIKYVLVADAATGEVIFNIYAVKSSYKDKQLSKRDIRSLSGKIEAAIKVK